MDAMWEPRSLLLAVLICPHRSKIFSKLYTLLMPKTHKHFTVVSRGDISKPESLLNTLTEDTNFYWRT